eukprot:scaffold45907_cov42-Tisochrysis_lutea.AAC.2
MAVMGPASMRVHVIFHLNLYLLTAVDAAQSLISSRPFAVSRARKLMTDRVETVCIQSGGARVH